MSYSEEVAPDILIGPVLAKYIGGIDREAAFREFSKML